jgi:MFS family permease
VSSLPSPPSAGSSYSGTPGTNEKILFWASFATLIAAGIGFSVRGVSLLTDWGNQFGFTQTELGTITGGGLVGFGLAIIFFSFCADRFGYGKLMLVAFLLHASSAVVTIAATPVYGAYGKAGAFWCLNLGMWLFALGNGTCEAVINPLTATLFPRSKTHWLNILHAGWPLGLILGAAIMLGFDQVGGSIRWEVKLGVFLIPVLVYGLLMFNRPFPKSEAQSAGVPLTGMMKQVGMLGFTLGAALIGLALSKLFQEVLGPIIASSSPDADMILRVIGWAVAGVVWLAFAYVTNFSWGSWVLAFLYLLHAMVGYVELGTDSWITNITQQVLKSGTDAQLAFIWTNVMMFTLRFFAGPIVHKINPLGLLFVSACLGTTGLWLLGQEFTNSVWPWVGAVTIYGIGKTFYWPTLLGVISERFPKGGALALGLSGGVGMIGAGVLGSAGIGYKQDYFSVEKLQQTPAGRETYERYVARENVPLTKESNPPPGQLDKKGFPLVSTLFPSEVPPVAGIDNAKYKVFQDYSAGFDADGKRKPDAKTTLQSDLATINEQEIAGKSVDPKLKENLSNLAQWWTKEGLPNYEKDKEPLTEAKLYGAKTALLYTAVVPAILAVGFLILLIYFAMTGGYKQVHLEDQHPAMEEY